MLDVERFNELEESIKEELTRENKKLSELNKELQEFVDKYKCMQFPDFIDDLNEYVKMFIHLSNYKG